MAQNDKKRKTPSRGNETIHPLKRLRLSSKEAPVPKVKNSQLPRPKRALSFAVPKHLTQEHSTPSIPRFTSKSQFQAESNRSGRFTPTTSTAAIIEPSLRLHKSSLLLTAIHRRNKNQHRNQPFYKHLMILRRAIGNLISIHEQSATLSTNQSNTISSVTAASTRERFEREAILRSHRESVKEQIRETIVPRAYVGFSGLVADTQFANLGVVLLGVLCDVVSVVGVMRRVERGEMGIRVAGESMSASTGEGGRGRVVGVSTLVTGPDQGVVVERTYDSDGAIDVGEKITTIGTKWRVERDEDIDLGEVVLRNGDGAQKNGTTSKDVGEVVMRDKVNTLRSTYNDDSEGTEAKQQRLRQNKISQTEITESETDGLFKSSETEAEAEGEKLRSELGPENTPHLETSPLQPCSRSAIAISTSKPRTGGNGTTSPVLLSPAVQILSRKLPHASTHPSRNPKSTRAPIPTPTQSRPSTPRVSSPTLDHPQILIKTSQAPTSTAPRGETSAMKSKNSLGITAADKNAETDIDMANTSAIQMYPQYKNKQKEKAEANARTKPSAKVKTKPKAKKKGNAIDDLFSGFG